IDGSLSATNGPEYITILGENGGVSRIGGDVTINGALGGEGQGSSPTVVICGAYILDDLNVTGTAANQGPGEFQPEFFSPAVVIGGKGCSRQSQFDEGGTIGTTNRIV